MSDIHLNQIRSHLRQTFDGKIDLSDYASKSQDERDSAFHSRAVAAFCVMMLADTTPDIAAASVTDGFTDNGIDAIHFHNAEETLYVIQSKWHNDGHGTIARGDLLKFLAGFRNLVNQQFDRFNEKVRAKRTMIESALTSTDTRFVLVIAYSGQDQLPDEQNRDLNDLLKDMNDPTETVSRQIIRQVHLHQMVSSGAKGVPINLEVQVREWGQTREPYGSFYGQVTATDIAEWHSLHPRLFAPNIRMFLGPTEVNQGMVETLRKDPENFWYFNNGITMLCGSVKKKPLGGPQRESGVFECTNVSIVNGAQTVGAIAFASGQDPDKVSKASVLVRFISLENCPEEFAEEVTRATNTQNRIAPRDFVVFDPQQERLKSELQLDKIQYAIKSGEAVVDKTCGFDVEEGSVAMACSNVDLTLAVIAKREAGTLLGDIRKEPYTNLFSESLTGVTLWYKVQLMRRIEQALATFRASLNGRDRMVPTHGNRLVAHLIFRQLRLEGLESRNGHRIDDVYVRVDQITPSTASQLISVVKQDHPDSYLAVLFKNTPKCKSIVQKIIGDKKPEQDPPSLFPDWDPSTQS